MIPLERITLIIGLLNEIHDDIQSDADEFLFRKYGERLNIAKNILGKEESELTPGTKFWDCIAEIAGYPILFWDTYKFIHKRVNMIDAVILDGIAVKNNEIRPRELKINHMCGRLRVYDETLSNLLDDVFNSEPDHK